MAELLSSSAYWAWLISIIAVAGLASFIIWFTTRTNMSSMARAAGQVLGEAESTARRAYNVKGPSFVTAASVRMTVSDETFILRLERRFHGEGALESGRAALSDLVSGLLDHGTEPEDIVGEGVEGPSEAGQVIAVASLLVRGKEGMSSLVGLSLQSGFREGHGARREVMSVEDAHEILGRRALERSRLNAEILSTSLKLGASFDLVGAELTTEVETELEGKRVVTMHARSTWSIAD